MWILAAICGIIVGYSIRFVQQSVVEKQVKDQTDVLLDEIETCGEVTSVKILEGWPPLRQIVFEGGVIFREGKWLSYLDGWSKEPVVYVKNVSISLTSKQMHRVQRLLDEKHAESGRQQITESLLK